MFIKRPTLFPGTLQHKALQFLIVKLSLEKQGTCLVCLALRDDHVVVGASKIYLSVGITRDKTAIRVGGVVVDIITAIIIAIQINPAILIITPSR